MKKFILIVFVLGMTFIFVSCTASSQQTDEFDVKETLDQLSNIQEATLLRPDTTDDYKAIQEKLIQALGADSEWYTEFRNEHRYYPYVYHERMGITQQEYEDMFIKGTYVILNEEEPQTFNCETYDDSSYSIYFPAVDLGFTVDVEKDAVTLEDGTVLSFAQSVDLDESENLLGEWVGSTYSYLDVQSNQTNKELSELGIHDEVFDIGHENFFAPMQAMLDGALECKYVSVTIGKYKGLDEYIIYYKHLDTVESVGDYYIFTLR